MTKLRLTKIMILVLVTAFLSMQWTTAHIHLAENHDHDGSHHQHSSQVHTHQSISQNDNFNNSNHQVDSEHVNVVEIDNECTTKVSKKFGEQSFVSTLVSFQQISFPLSASIALSEVSYSKHRYSDYSTINLRAPPEFS